MTAADILPILPLCVLAATAVLLLLLIAFRRNHAAAAAVSVLGLVLAFAAVPVAAGGAPVDVTQLIAVDGYALIFQGLILLAALAVALLSSAYFARRESVPREEYYVLLLTATLGAATLVASRHFASFFLGLETLSLSLVALVAYPAAAERPVEAGLKYLLLSGVSSAFLLFGIALVYFVAGGLSLDSLAYTAAHSAAAAPLTGAAPSLSSGLGQLPAGAAPLSAASPAGAAPVAAGIAQLYGLAGMALILVGVGFKLSVVPFHLWAPDVYEGAPAPVGGFIAVVSKAAVLALLLRYYLAATAFSADPPLLILSAAAILSMLIGNLLALLQRNVKRILAYSSIAHLGYALVAFLSGGSLAIEAVGVYLVAYAVSTLGAFGVITMLSGADALRDSTAEGGRDADDLEDYRGLFRSRPWVATALTLMLLSLAGIPITVGFVAKFYAAASGVGASLTAPVGALVAGSIIGLYYYLRIIVAMLQPAPPQALVAPAASPRVLTGAVMGILALLAVALGIYPSPLVGLIREAATPLAADEPGPLAAAPSRSSALAGASLIRDPPRPHVDSRPSASETARPLHHRGSAP